MSQTDLKDSVSSKPEKFCQHCGQKTFRPHRSVRELLWEFVENWFGYDSKAYKTARALCKPAALTRDYFRNSHHNNHYVTPIRLYIFLSIIFFLLTKFGGFNIAKADINLQNNNAAEQQVQQAIVESPIVDEEAKKQIAKGNAEPIDLVDKNLIDKDLERDDGIFDLEQSCKDSETMFEFSTQWLDDYFDQRAVSLCEAYDNIAYLPEEKQTKAKVQFWLAIVQSAVESLPQIFLFTTPLLALLLFLLYLRSSHLYVEHLVLLIHSHCFMFAAILTYLGWHQLVKALPALGYIPIGWILLLWVVVYLFMSMKRFYQQGFWKTSLKFMIFSLVYLVVFGFIAIFATMAALMSI